MTIYNKQNDIDVNNKKLTVFFFYLDACERPLIDNHIFLISKLSF